MKSITFLQACEAELQRARIKHPRAFASYYEGAGVLLEEIQEFVDEIRRQEHDTERIVNELTQVGAMAMRISEDLYGQSGQACICRVQEVPLPEPQPSWHGLYGFMCLGPFDMVTWLGTISSTVETLTEKGGEA